MAEISVIVPVYNVSLWLQACLESIASQNFTDFECILVDDGSTDACPQICDEKCRQDARFKVIHKANGGLSSARNAGLDAAAGKYISFIDSDDFVLPNYLEVLYRALLKNNADMAVCAVEDVTEDGKSFSPAHVTRPARPETCAGDKLLPQFYQENSTYYTVAWNKLYSAELWKGFRYPEGLLYEDDATAHVLYHRSGKVVCLDKALYKYRLRSGSIVRTSMNPSRFDSVTAMGLRYKYFVENDIPEELQQKTLVICWRRYLEFCALARENNTPEIYARWQKEQLRMRALITYLPYTKGLSIKEKASCALWASKKLPQPAEKV